MYDLKIKNAKIVDGTGLNAFYGDIAVIGDTIVNRGKNLGKWSQDWCSKCLWSSTGDSRGL